MPIIKLFNHYVKSFNVSENFADGRPFIDGVELTTSREKATIISEDMVSRVLAVVRKMASKDNPNGESLLIHVTSSRRPYTRKTDKQVVKVNGDKLRLYFLKRGIKLVDIGISAGMAPSTAHNVIRYFKRGVFPYELFNQLRRNYPSIAHYVIVE